MKSSQVSLGAKTDKPLIGFGNLVDFRAAFLFKYNRSDAMGFAGVMRLWLPQGRPSNAATAAFYAALPMASTREQPPHALLQGPQIRQDFLELPDFAAVQEKGD